MAVKQNNTDENKPDTAIETELNMQQNKTSESDTSNNTSNNKKIKKKENFKHNQNLNEPNSNNKENELNQIEAKKLKMLIEYFYKIANDKMFASKIESENIIDIANQILNELAFCALPSDPVQIKIFKTDIQQVGDIFVKVSINNEKYFYISYLEQVIRIITNFNKNEFDNNSKDFNKYPSCAIAIIFELFPETLIQDTISFLFSSSDIFSTDKSIIRTVKCLSIWLRQCTFVTHLNMWILAILNQIRQQRKYDLLRDIMYDIIEPLFLSLIVPILRPKVYPIIFDILISIKDTPIIFHKIIGRAPKVIKQLKNELSTNEVEKSRKIYQELIALIVILIEHFPDSNNLYKDMEEVLADCNISHYRALLEKSILDSNNAALFNSTNPKVGLVNLGNTCYMNSVLQALLMTKDFCREILLTDIKSPLIVKVQQLFAQLLHSQRPDLTPTTVLSATRPSSFSCGSQQDSSEFLDYLLETFHEQEINLFNKQNKKIKTSLEDIYKDNHMTIDKKDNETIKVDLNLTSHTSMNMEIDSDDSYNTSPTKDNICSNTKQLSPINSITTPTSSQQDNTQINRIPSTIIDKIFTGKMAYTYKCLNCQCQSNIRDKFRDLPLSFPDKIPSNTQEIYSVQELLDHYYSPEILNGENQYYCDKCKNHCDAELIKYITSAPKNLILTLKQFKYDKNNHMRAKLMHKVYHNKEITLKVFNTNTETNTDNDSVNELNKTYCNYELYAAVVHTGFSMDSGHYYTYATDNINNNCADCNNSISSTYKNDDVIEWYKFNDNIVTMCCIAELHKLTPPNTPYILFYRMQSKFKKNSNMTESNCIEHIEIPKLPTLDELPSNLRDIVNNDNLLFNKETKFKQMNNNTTTMNIRNSNRRDKNDDDDNDPPPPPSNCGGNALDININNYIF